MNAALRLSGIAAVLGGALRILTAIVPDPFDWPLWSLYLAIDLLLLVGWIGIFAAHRRQVGALGLLAALLGAAGLAALIARDALHLDTRILGTNIYILGAGALLVAFAGLSLLMSRARPFSILITALACAAPVAGLASQFLGQYALVASRPQAPSSAPPSPSTAPPSSSTATLRRGETLSAQDDDPAGAAWAFA